MINKSKKTGQGYLVGKDLLEQLDPKNKLILLGKKIDWDRIVDEFSCFYSEFGRPAKPIRLMVGLLLLKQLYNLSDDKLVEHWVQNPYFQAFCGEERFRWKFPCEPSDLTYFRKRIGEKGAEILFQLSIEIHGEKAQEESIIVDTTVQEKNITFPTDNKSRIKVINNCIKIANKEGIKLRRSYARELRGLKRTIRFQKRNKTKEYKKAVGKIKTIANVLIRELRRKLPKNILVNYMEYLDILEKVTNQKKNDKEKVYSIHEPKVACIAKSKEHKKYEFGSKVSIAMTKDSAIIIGAKNFEKNVYDGNTLPYILEQIKRLCGYAPKNAYCDRGFRSSKTIEETRVIIPDNSRGKGTKSEKKEARKNFGRRSAIEPIIGHLKSDFRLARNYLKGTIGDKINLLLSVTAFNLAKWMRCIFAKRLNFFLHMKISFKNFFMNNESCIFQNVFF